MNIKKIDLKTTKGFIIGVIFTLTITMGITGVVFAANSTFEGMQIINVTVNNKLVTGDVPAVAMNGRTMVPLKFVSEALGATVTWDAATGTANVKTVAQVDPVTPETPTTPPITPTPVAPSNDVKMEEFENFKSLFNISKKEITNNNEILYDVVYNGVMNPSEFWMYWSGLQDELKVENAKKYALEVQNSNSTYTSALYFKFGTTDLGYAFAYPKGVYNTEPYALSSFKLNPFNIHSVINEYSN